MRGAAASPACSLVSWWPQPPINSSSSPHPKQANPATHDSTLEMSDELLSFGKTEVPAYSRKLPRPSHVCTNPNRAATGSSSSMCGSAINCHTGIGTRVSELNGCESNSNDSNPGSVRSQSTGSSTAGWLAAGPRCGG
eukprot:3099740-Prymnesium_polylepis.1